MGFMNKIKNLFTEEIEDEELVNPIKKEIQVSIPSPIEENKVTEEVKKEDEIIENSAIQKEEKFVFPVFFDDKDFDTLEPPKPREETTVKRETYGGATIDVSPKKEEHIFKPTPIISPVYGILDKNYKKEDISTKKRSVSLDDYYAKPKSLTVDDIRNKAYGTLEDDLESTLVGPMGPIYEKKQEIVEDNDMFEELEHEEVITVPTDAAIDDFINEESDDKIDLELNHEKIEENLVADEINNYEEGNNNVEDELNDSAIETNENDFDINNIYEDSNETLNDSDLFNLIDSMYEDGDEE